MDNIFKIVLLQINQLYLKNAIKLYTHKNSWVIKVSLLVFPGFLQKKQAAVPLNPSTGEHCLGYSIFEGKKGIWPE